MNRDGASPDIINECFSFLCDQTTSDGDSSFFFKNGFYGNYILYSFFDTFIKGSSFCHLILSLHLTLCPSILPFLIHSICSSKSSCPVYEHKRNSNINTTNQNYEYDGKFVSVLLRAEYLNYKKYFSKRAHQWHYLKLLCCAV